MRIRLKHSRAAFMAAASISGLGLATTVNAQETEGPVEEVVVTGFRASLATALESKRESNQIIESVAAEDIGKFPDQNVAEALQRLSGVQIDRSNGQGTKVRIRGLEQNVTLLNSDIFLTGLELYTQGEGNYRETDSLEGIPSELLGGVDVYKSPNASQLEGGLGGIVNLKTRNPFSLGEGLNLAGNVRYADAGEGWEPLGALVASHKFNDRLAVIASVSYDKQVFQTDVLGGQNRGGWKFTDRVDRVRVPQNYIAPEYRYATDRDEERERLGASLSVAFRPTDSVEIEGMYFHSQLDILTEEASVKFPFASETPGIDTSQPYSIDSNGVLLNGVFTANSAEAISFVKNTEISSDNFQLSTKWDNGGPIRASVAGAYSKADQESGSANNDVRYTQYTVRQPGGGSGFAPNASAPQNYQFRYDYNGGELPSFSLLNNSDLFTNPNNGFFKSHWAFGDTTDAENWSARADMEWDLPFFAREHVTLSGGLRGARREIDYEFGRYLADHHGSSDLDGIDYGANWTNYGYYQDGAIGPKACDSLSGGGAPLGTPGRPNCAVGSRFDTAPALILPYHTLSSTPGRVEQINDFWRSGNAGTNSVLVQYRGQMSNALAWIQSLYPNTPFVFFPSPLETFNVEEKTTSGYLMADIGQPSDGYHINVGARILRTELTVAQNAASSANPTYWGTDSWNGVLRDFETNVSDRSYTDFLPSANIVIDLAEGHKLRVSAAKVVARQDLFQLGRGFATEFTRNPVTDLFEFTNGSSGNPELEPYRAKQFDLGYEYYFGAQGLAAVTAFRKNVDSFITEITESVFVMDQTGGRFGPVRRPINGEGGKIEGFEVAGQYAFGWGGGFNINYTYSDSESPFFNDIDSGLPIPGVAKHAYNAQIYYQNLGFEARLSYTWRDKSFDSNFQFGDQVAPFSSSPSDDVTRTLGVWNREYGQLDAQLGYQVTDNIGLTLEAINLTEQDQSAYFQYENLPFAYESGSRRILVGVRGTFGGAGR